MDELMQQRASILIEALPYIRRWSGKVMVIKYGGAAMEDPASRASFAEDLVLLQHVGVRPVVVHGGGPQISEYMKRLGIEPQFVGGRRVTDEETLRVAQMVLVGLVGQDIVSDVFQAGGKAVSVSGKDAQTIVARRRQVDGADLGLVGDVVRINPELLVQLCNAGYLPVVSTTGMGEDGLTYNINADSAAGAIAAALSAEKIVILTDVPGLLADPSDERTLISTLSLSEARRMLAEGQVEGGMVPKLEACVVALESGVRRAHLIDGRVPHALIMELFTDRGIGTMIEAG